MRILNIALGLVLVGNAMAEPKLSDIYRLAVANGPSCIVAVRGASEALEAVRGAQGLNFERKCVSKRNAEPQK